jgi:hypothetical protein
VAGFFVPLADWEARRVARMLQARGLAPDGQGIREFLLLESKRKPSTVGRIAQEAATFAERNPDAIRTLGDVARVLLDVRRR